MMNVHVAGARMLIRRHCRSVMLALLLLLVACAGLTVFALTRLALDGFAPGGRPAFVHRQDADRRAEPGGGPRPEVAG